MLYKKVNLIIIILYEMKSYPIMSINKKFCNNTKAKYLDKLRTCSDTAENYLILVINLLQNVIIPIAKFAMINRTYSR